MRILILGGAGMLGHELWKQLHQKYEVWVTLRRPLAAYKKFGLFQEDKTLIGIDAIQPDDLVDAIRAAKPSVIVNCIGIIKQLKKASNAITSLEINSVLPHRLARVAEIAGARLFHMSTDCVFNGRKGNYTEDDPSDAEDLYGRTKFLGELPYNNCVTIRSSIIGHELESRSGLIEWFLSQAGSTVKGFRRAIYTGFTTIEMARIIELIITRFPDLHGVWQISGEPINKFDLLTLAKRHYHWQGEIIPDDQFYCDRSLNSERFRAETGYAPPSWEEMMSELSKERAVSPNKATKLP
jgi:dTDP-4-dehydrorhamnose reductase